MQLLTEVINPERKAIITENRGEFIMLRGLFLEGEIENQNGRVYPREEVEKAVFGLQERIKKNPVAGELDHPEGLNINFDRVSHVITEINMDGNNGVGSMKVINAGMGLIVKGCIEAGMDPGVSSRGSGNIGPSGKVSDFDIVTIDMVINPSAPNAYPKASLSEALANNKNGREALSLVECVKYDNKAQQYLSNSIKDFLMDIRDEVTWRK